MAKSGLGRQAVPAVILSAAKDLGAPTETTGAISQRFFGRCASSE